MSESSRGALRSVVFALAPTLVVLGGLELGLKASDVASRETTALHAHGFDASAAYFVPDPEGAGSHLTQMFGGAYDEIRIPPKGDDTRVFLFGGSNTQGFSVARLQDYLEEELPGRSFEIVNLGREGYGSGRVSILLEQSLRLEPDLCIVYSGHNEFVEDGYREEVEQDQNSTSGRVRSALSGLRTYRWLEARFSPASAATDAGKSDTRPPPAAFQVEYAKFSDQTYDELQARMEVYAENLRDMARACEQAGVPMLLSTIITNHFSPPYASTPAAGSDPAEVSEAKRLVFEARKLLPDFVQALDFAHPSQRLQARSWKKRPGPVNPPAPPVRSLSLPMGEFDFRPKTSRWSEDVWAVSEQYGRFATLEVTDSERASLEEADELLEQALEHLPDDPRALFLRGLVAHRAGDLESAGRWLRDAQRFDRAPRKASDLTNDWVRQVAAQFPGVHLHEADAQWRECSPGGAFGYELLGDNCHLHPAASQYLMRDFARHLGGIDW